MVVQQIHVSCVGWLDAPLACALWCLHSEEELFAARRAGAPVSVYLFVGQKTVPRMKARENGMTKTCGPVPGRISFLVGKPSLPVPQLFGLSVPVGIRI